MSEFSRRNFLLGAAGLIISPKLVGKAQPVATPPAASIPAAPAPHASGVYAPLQSQLRITEWSFESSEIGREAPITVELLAGDTVIERRIMEGGSVMRAFPSLTPVVSGGRLSVRSNGAGVARFTWEEGGVPVMVSTQHRVEMPLALDADEE